MSHYPRLAAVLGLPIAHSLSPALHAHWFERHGIRGHYVPLAVQPEDLAPTMALLPRLGFAGWNVTIPHKEAAVALVAELDPAAAAMRAVNTVLVRADGTLLGLNTDGLGFLANLREQAPGWSPADGPAVLLGTGGAARAVAHALIGAGVGELCLVNRTQARADALAAALAGEPATRPAVCRVVPWAERAGALAGAGLLVQGTSQGLVGQGALDLDLRALPGHATVAELVYRPLETPLLAAARLRGNPVVDGLGMLIGQAVPGFAHWGGVTPAVDAATRAALLAALAAP